MPETKTLPSTIINKPHFEILDGLRGVAAIAVVIFHFMEIAITDPENNFIAHAYLAVDFFFCLSGFVIAYAYEPTLSEMIWIMIVGTALLLLLAYAVLKYIDEPIRKWLGRK